MSEPNVDSYKKGKLKMFFFFLFISSFIWILSKFSKEFTATVEANLQYINVPNNTELAKDNPKWVSFDLTTSGFNFIYFKFKKPNIGIDISKYRKNNKLVLDIPNQEFIKIITTQLKNNIAVKNLSINNLSILLEAINSKKIPILLVSEISYKSGYKQIESTMLQPDSIVITGPKSEIDSVKQIKTKLLKASDLFSDFNEEIAIEPPLNDKFSSSIKKVMVTIKVDEFTQKSLTIPIEIINLPKNIDIKLIPESAEISFDVTIKNFNKHQEKDFTVICDFKKRNEKENFMVLEIVNKPDGIDEVTIPLNKIDYLIFK